MRANFFQTADDRALGLLEPRRVVRWLYLARFSVHFVMSREPQELDVFNGRLDAPKVRELAQGAFDPAAVDEYFLCGPGTMIEDIRGELARLGAHGRIHVEHFTPLAEAASARVSSIPSGSKTCFRMKRWKGVCATASTAALTRIQP